MKYTIIGVILILLGFSSIFLNYKKVLKDKQENGFDIVFVLKHLLDLLLFGGFGFLGVLLVLLGLLFVFAV